jgi:hypothetical protein
MYISAETRWIYLYGAIVSYIPSLAI